MPARSASHCLSGVASAKAYLSRGRRESPSTPTYERAPELRTLSMVRLMPDPGVPRGPGRELEARELELGEDSILARRELERDEGVALQTEGELAPVAVRPLDAVGGDGLTQADRGAGRRKTRQACLVDERGDRKSVV